MKSLHPQWKALGLVAALSVPHLKVAAAQSKAATPAKKTAAKPVAAKPAAPKPGTAKPAAAKPPVAKPAAPKPATPALPKPSPALVKSVEALNSILYKNTVVNQTRSFPDGGKGVLKRGWKAEAGAGNRLILSRYQINETTETPDQPLQRQENRLRLELPLKGLGPDIVRVSKVEKKKKPLQRITIGQPGGKSPELIKVAIISKVLPVDETNPDQETLSAMASYSFTFPEAPWTAEFVTKLKEVIAVGSK